MNIKNLAAKHFLKNMKNILLLNLLGKRFHIPYRLVANYPQTLLGNKQLLSTYYRHDINDYYFERNPLLFPYILTYYTLEKKIFCPHNIPIELLKNECEFFQLNNPNIYSELNKPATYQYFPRNSNFKKDSFIDIIPFLTGLLFMITASMETLNTNSSWSLSYFIELFSTLFLTGTILYQAIYKQKDFFRNKCFLFDLFSTLLSIIVIASQNFMLITNYHRINSLIILLKTLRLFIVIAHLRILRLMILTFIQR